jgi:2-dehydro-3-deoxygluconokinase
VDPITSLNGNVKQYDLITLGESMWRLAPPGFQRLDTARSLDVQVGGAESNVAIALARLGKRVAWWSRLPENALGQHVAQTLTTFGVDVSGVFWEPGARLGTYFVEFGSAPRATQVVYDRANSAASHMKPSDFDWTVLAETRWLHLTGITPALSVWCLETAHHAIRSANEMDVPVSFDVNYRAKLWSWDEARPVIDRLAGMCSMVITALRDARSHTQKPDANAETLARELHSRWNGATIMLTKGAEGALAYDGETIHDVPAFKVPNIVDRIGAGDSFDAGLLCGLLDGLSLPDAMRFGHAVAAIKMTIPGDIALTSRAEVERLLSEASHDVQR